MFTAACIPATQVFHLQLGIDVVDEGFIGCHAWTFQECLHLSASHHSLRYSEAMVLEYLQMVETAIGESLGVDSIQLLVDNIISGENREGYNARLVFVILLGAVSSGSTMGVSFRR
jgi:hypothetical protein